MSEVPDGFRDTPLGPLPETWDVVRLGDFVKVRYGKARPCGEGVIPAIGSGGIYAWVSESLVDFATLIIGRKGTAGRVWLQETPCWPSDTTFYLEWKSDGVDYRFVHRWLQERPLSGEHAKTTLPSLSRPDVENYLIPLPSLPEQRAIAHVLRTVQRAREATDGVIAAVRELKRSLMRHLFTYGPVPVHEAERVELREAEIGPIPAHWEMVRLGDAIEEGPQNGMYKPQSLYGRGTPIVRIDDYENEGNVVTRARNRVQLSEAEVSKYGLRLNDILVNRVNSLSHLGKTALIGPLVEPMVFESNMMRFRVNQRLADPEYVFRFLCAPICRDQMRGMAKRAVAQSSINQGDVKSIALPRPPLAEQRQMTHILSMVDAKIAAEEARREALDRLFHSLLHHLMTGRIRMQGFQRQAARTPSREEENLGDLAP